MADPRFPLVRLCSLGARTISLFGPADPSRNGPFDTRDITVKNPRFCETTYRRGASYSPTMLSITVDQVFRAVQRRMEAAA
jgi:ADP-heptose:LPS heptosyltransferase